MKDTKVVDKNLARNSRKTGHFQVANFAHQSLYVFHVYLGHLYLYALDFFKAMYVYPECFPYVQLHMEAR